MAEIVIDTALRHPPDRVWRALTDPSVLSAWFMATDAAPTPGGNCTFTPHGLAGFAGPIAVEVRQFVAPRLLVLAWKEDAAQSSVTWEITPSDDGCTLSLRQNGFFGVQGFDRQADLRQTYALLLRTRLPAMLERLASGLTAPVPVWALGPAAVPAGAGAADEPGEESAALALAARRGGRVEDFGGLTDTGYGLGISPRADAVPPLAWRMAAVAAADAEPYPDPADDDRPEPADDGFADEGFGQPADPYAADDGLEPPSDPYGPADPYAAAPGQWTNGPWVEPTTGGRGEPAPEPAAPAPNLHRERRRYAVVGAGIGAVLAVSATAGALFFAAPGLLSSLGAAGGPDGRPVAGSGGVGRAEVSTDPSGLTGRRPTPAAAPSTGGAGAGGPQPGNPDPRPHRPDPTRPGPDPGNGRPDPGNGRPRVTFGAAYHTEGRRTEVMVGNLTDNPATGWRVVITLSEEVEVKDVRNATATVDGNRVEFRSRGNEAVPANDAVAFRFTLRGRGVEIAGCTVNGAPCQAGEGGEPGGRGRYAYTDAPREGVTGFDSVRGDRGSEPRKPTSSR
ncbi:hypothetical protein GCM10010123_39810 [Pilimelia anulata]|uniref:CBM2 domain-containing protein n=1 Tax=Pilimelia anulata TaxID=53371 RepID=A0A8J3B9T8_9ACTN|nr:hypothetical protein GCM10010123_39810 [Pilimelia anulata]